MKQFERILAEKKAAYKGTTVEWHFGWDERLGGHCEVERTFHHDSAKRLRFGDYSNTALLITNINQD